jgi:hypothetical protein
MITPENYVCHGRNIEFHHGCNGALKFLGRSAGSPGPSFICVRCKRRWVEMYFGLFEDPGIEQPDKQGPRQVRA